MGRANSLQQPGSCAVWGRFGFGKRSGLFGTTEPIGMATDRRSHVMWRSQIIVSICRVWYSVDLDRENQNARRTGVCNAGRRTHDQHRCYMCPPQSNRGGPTVGPNLDCSSGPRNRWQTSSRTRRTANTRGADPSINSPRLSRLPGMRLARPDAQTASRYRPQIERPAVSCSLETHP